MVLITARNIYKKITLPPEVTLDLLQNINFTINRGEFITFVGESGCGKTSLMGILLGYDQQFEGSVSIKDSDLRTLDEEQLNQFRTKNFGICFEDKAPIILTDTVKENIVRRMKDLENVNFEEEVSQLIYLFNLEKIQDIPLTSGSILNVYRLMLAMAYCGGPPIIVIDESLDYFPGNERKKLLDNIIALQKKQNNTILMVTSYTDIILKADRCFQIKDFNLHEVNMKKFREKMKNRK
jgi:ABC-type lipoprotein export system ATPase subunit